MKRGVAGSYETAHVAGEQIQAFIPHPLPPKPSLELNDQRQRLLERATLALGRLDSITLLLSDPALFLYAYVRREAVLSSQIEGTQSSLAQLLLFELEEAPGVPLDDVTEVSNYVAALNHGLVRMKEGFPLSNRLIREMHAILSLYFKQHRSEYYRLLDLVRTDGDWEAWVDFFLEGVAHTASNAVETARRLVRLFQQDEQKVQTLGRSASTALRVFRALCERPLVTLNQICKHTGLSFPAASKAMQALEGLGIVQEITGRRRNRAFAYQQYLTILSEGTESL